MKKLLLILSLFACFTTFIFASDDEVYSRENGTEIGISFSLPLALTDTSFMQKTGFGGSFTYRKTRDSIWCIQYGGSITFPTKSSEDYNKYLIFNADVALALRVFDNKQFSVYASPTLGYKFVSNNLWPNAQDLHVRSFLWIGADCELDYKITSDLFVTAGALLEYDFYKISGGQHEAIGEMVITPKLGLVLLM